MYHRNQSAKLQGNQKIQANAWIFYKLYFLKSDSLCFFGKGSEQEYRENHQKCEEDSTSSARNISENREYIIFLSTLRYTPRQIFICRGIFSKNRIFIVSVDNHVHFLSIQFFVC